MKELYKKIFKQIKKYNNIVIARHIGPDPDALGSQFALKEIIKNQFPEKKVLAVGNPASRFRFMGTLDKYEELNEDTLLIVLDTPDLKRIDIDDITKYQNIIKIDHHPFIEKYASIELINEEASSTSQIIIDMALILQLKLTQSIAKNLYLGVIADTDRFLHDYTSKETFQLVTKLIKKTNLDFTSLYPLLYTRPYSEIKFQGYIYQNLNVNEEGVAYIRITEDIIKEFGVDSASAGNMINDLKFVDGITVWVFFSEDIKNNLIRANIRSGGPTINEVASKYNGGGHKYASGARLTSWTQADSLVEDLTKVVKEYNNKES